MAEHISIDVRILSIKESKETVKLGETRDITTVLFAPAGYPPQRVVIPTEIYTTDELNKTIALRLRALRNNKPISMVVKIPVEEIEDEEE